MTPRLAYAVLSHPEMPSALRRVRNGIGYAILTIAIVLICAWRV